MNDFETLIGKALAEGTDPTALASQIDEAYKKALEQKKAAEAKAKEMQKQSARDKLIEGVDLSFHDHYKEGNLTIADAAALAFLVTVNDTEFGHSLNDEEDLKDLFEHITNLLNSIEDGFKIRKEMKSIFGPILDKMDFNKMFNVNKSKEKKGDTERKKVCTCGTDRITKPPMSDREIILKFLENL